MRRRVVVGFIIPLGFALLTSFAVYRIISDNSRALRRAIDTSRVSENLGRLIKSVVDAQTGERGFVITGDEAFLEPYVASGAEFGVALSRLRRSLPDDTSQESLNKIDALFERWHREVAEVAISLREQAPLDFSAALQGASAAFTRARVAALRFELTGEAAQLTRAGQLLGEVQRQLGRAQNLLSGPQLTEVRAAAGQVELYARSLSAAENRRSVTPEGARGLEETLFELAAAAESAERKVTGIIRAGTGKRLVDEIRAEVDELSERVNRTLGQDLAASNVSTMRTQWVAFIGPLFAALVSLLAILEAQRRLNRSVRKLAVVAKGIAAGQLERRLILAQDDELRPLAEDFNRMVARLSERERQNAQLEQFSSTLQTCVTTAEAYRVAERFGPQLFGALAGTLYLIDGSRNLLETVSSWGEGRVASEETPLVHVPSDCWALRRSRPLLVDGVTGIVCPHAPTPAPVKSLCVPLGSQDETLGLLYLFTYNTSATLTDATTHFAVTVAEQLALTLSNLRLRESLKQQSVRDPLTGLFNRRHLEETLTLELHRAARRGESVSLIVFDVDHFKACNDRFGHDAGDAVLRTISGLVQECIRAGDVACRFGGEEFVLVQPGMPAEGALKRAETLREAVADYAFEHGGGALGRVTVSLGVATYPEHARTGDDLVKRADEALYRAKRAGRNRAVLAASVQESV